MTDKDPKDMTASELLRWAANYANITCRACQEMGFGCDDANDCDCDNAWGFIADKIDAELAQARELSLRQGAELWAKANGWPDFKPGEDFGAWLYRCAIPRPRFESGEPVQFGEETDVGTVAGFVFNAPSRPRCCAYEVVTEENGAVSIPDGDVLKRPAPEVLGADGLPLDEDDTVYGTGREQHRYTVQVPYSINEEVGKRFCVQCYDHDEGNITWCDPSMLTHERPAPGADGLPIKVGETVWGILSGSKGIVNSLNDESTAYVEWDDGRWSPCIDCCNLTHTPPDTQQKIDEDAEKFHCVYFGGYSACGTCPASTGELSKKSCKQQQIFDLLRRQRELDKRTGGAE